VIVTGVLVALGLDSWTQGRRDRDRELAYLSDLYDELVASIEVTSGVIEFETRLRDYLGFFEGAVAEQRSVPADSLAFWFDRTLRSGSYRPGAAIADALIETGDLSLIRNPDIRRHVIEYRERAQQTRETVNVFDASSLEAVASINRRVDRQAIRQYELDQNEWQLIASDPVIRGDLETHGIAVTARLDIAQDLLDIASALKAEVTAELQSRGRLSGDAR